MATQEEIRVEWIKCSQDPGYFIDEYCKIYDATLATWIPFKLWVEQLDLVESFEDSRLHVILKARQLGLTWLVLAYILWRMLYKPSATVLLFSRRETESLYLLSANRLRGIYNRLPEWMHVREVISDSTHTWQLSNGSVAYAFPTTAGDSYTASIVFVDEADLVPDLPQLMNAVKPTIDGGGQMILLSRTDKETPGSTFKQIYLAAKRNVNGWTSHFLPWWARPERDIAWYEAQKADIQARTHALDDLYQQYPSTDTEALMPPTLNKRLPFVIINQCYVPLDPIEEDVIPLPGMRIYVEKDQWRSYVIGADPAEGNPTSDDSSAHVLDAETGEEIALWKNKTQPGDFAEGLIQLKRYYNQAPILVERNNHGHAVILAIRDVHGEDVEFGWDGGLGWQSSGRGKALMYTIVGDVLKEGQAIIHDEDTFNQLCSIVGKTLRAPEGFMDDVAVSFCLAIVNKQNAGAYAEVGESPDKDHRG